MDDRCADCFQEDVQVTSTKKRRKSRGAEAFIEEAIALANLSGFLMDLGDAISVSSSEESSANEARPAVKK